MRLLTILAVAVALLYSAYWVTGRWAVTRGTDALLADLSARGWQVDASDISTRGFPSRFDTTATGLSVTTPDGAVTWSAPVLQVLALSYRPTEVIVAFPPEQTLDLPGVSLTLAADRLRASAATAPTPALPLREAIVESGPLTLASDIGASLDVARTLLAIRATDTPATYDLFTEASGIAPPPALVAMLTDGTALPPAIDGLRLDGHVTLTEPLDRHAQDPRPTELTLTEAALRWGTARLALSGTLAFDAAGRANGTLTVTADDLPLLIDIAARAGLIDPDTSAGLIATTESLTEDGTLTAPVTVTDGTARFAFLTLGTIPPLR